jgi:hypothetical protein
MSHYIESRLISRDDAPTQGRLTKDGALELLTLSLNNSKGFSKKAMIFSEFQVFRIIAPGLVENSSESRSGENKLLPGGVSLDRYGCTGRASGGSPEDDRKCP